MCGMSCKKKIVYLSQFYMVIIMKTKLTIEGFILTNKPLDYPEEQKVGNLN